LSGRESDANAWTKAFSSSVLRVKNFFWLALIFILAIPAALLLGGGDIFAAVGLKETSIQDLVSAI